MISIKMPHRLVLLAALLLPAAAPEASPLRIPLGPATSVAIPASPSTFVRLGDRIYFSAADPLYGNEVWITDGSDAGTRRLTDLCPGACSIVPANFAALGERVFFTVTEESANSLYAVDGDAVSLVARFPGYLAQMVATGGELWLLGYGLFDPRTTVILRSSGAVGDLRLLDTLCDGTGCSTARLAAVADTLLYLKNYVLRSRRPGGEPQDLVPLISFTPIAALAGGRVLFRGCGTGACSIYNSDGTAVGTFPVAEDGPPFGSNFTSAAWNGSIYWAGWSGKLMRSDGSVAGTVDLGTAARGVAGATSSHLFYTRYGSAPGELQLRALATDGADVELLQDAGVQPEVLGTVANSIFLTFHGSLHVSDGTVAGTRRLANLASSAAALPSQTLDGWLYAAVNRDSPLAQAGPLWRFDAAGHAEAFPAGRSAPVGDGARPLALGASLLAGEPDSELWQVDVATLAAAPLGGPSFRPVIAAAGKVLLYSYPSHYELLTAAGLEPLSIEPYSSFVASSDGTFFWGEVGPGQKLWAGDGTAAGSREIYDFFPAWAPSGCSYHCTPLHPRSLAANGDDIYFLAPARLEGPNAEAAIWVYHHDRGRLDRLKAFYDSPVADISFFPVARKVVFELGGLDEPKELWVTDGTPAGTRQIVGTELGIGSFSLLGSVGEQLFFTDRYAPNRLFISDLTPGGVHLLLERPGLAIAEVPTATAGDHFFFAAFTFELGAELWTSDGTAAGTRALDLRAGPLGSAPLSLLAVGKRLIFSADRGDFGHELYESDGTLEGTRLVADLAPGAAPSTPTSLKAVGERIFLTADDGFSGRGLWALDLPPAAPSSCPPQKLCLQDGRFEVAVTAQGQVAVAGKRVLTSAESGVFSFFGNDNWELLVKVLDGCAINQRFWVYSAAATDVPFVLTVKDRASGEERTYEHRGPGAASPALDGDAFASCGLPAPAPAYGAILPRPPAAPRCSDDPAAFCFGAGGRFRAKVDWRTSSASGAGRPAPFGSADSGLFTFFSPSNWELMVKVLDGCATNGHHWVYAAATTDVGWHLTIEDTATGALREYENAPGSARPAITDGDAFVCP